MNRRGMELSVGFVVIVALLLILTIVALFWIKNSNTTYKESLVCPASVSKPDPAGKYVCARTCPDGYTFDGLKVNNCPPPNKCCVPDSEYKPLDGFVAPTVELRLYEVRDDPNTKNGGFTTTLLDKPILPGGSSVEMLDGRPKVILVEAIVKNCGNYKPKETSDSSGITLCDPTGDEDHFVFSLETKTGTNIIDLRAKTITYDGKQTSLTGPGAAVTIPGELTDYPAGNVFAIEPQVSEGEGKRTEEFSVTRAFLFEFPSEYNGETITFRAKAVVPYKKPGSDKQLEASAESTLLFKPKPVVRYGPLTTQWEKTKTITATCEKQVNCDNIYFKIIDARTAGIIQQTTEKEGGDSLVNVVRLDDSVGVCPKLDDEQVKNAVAFETVGDYCLMDRFGKDIGCWNTLEACLELGLAKQVDSNYATARQIILSGVKSGVLPEEISVVLRDLQQFQEAESKSSTYSCQRSLSSTATTSGDGKTLVPGLNTVFRAPKITSTDPRWRFTLDMPFMTNQYICVYGEERHTMTTTAGPSFRSEFFTAGKPQRLYIDRIPPTATIKFNPWTLVITVTCEDSESGCPDESWGYAYVNDLTAFISTLAREANSKSAAIWCPPYASGHGYTHQSQRETIYNVPEVRVLCARVEDKAGNAGVTLTTVYNSYDIFFGLLAKYVQEEQKDQRSGLPP